MKYTCAGIVLLCFSICSAEIHVGGVISRDTRWNSEDGPFFIDSDLLIEKNVRLTITSGAKIIIGRNGYCSTIPQRDRMDSISVSIKVSGSLICIGRSNKRISFVPENLSKDTSAWYGIVFDNCYDSESELAFCDITAAYYGITVINSKPLIRNCVLEHNFTGVQCCEMGNMQLVNCIIANNFSSGIRVKNSNPLITNNIIYKNRNLGLWCDGLSKITIRYNLFSKNEDGNLLECDPEIGVLVKVNKNRDSVDLEDNLFKDPVFSGSVADSIEVENDLSLPTDKSRVKNSILAAIIHEDGPSKPIKLIAQSKYELSRYSPCIDAGNPSEIYKDRDGTRNDMGISGGSEVSPKKK